jgi:methyltransferase-like protein/SAM-dependent methyltransferase
MSSTVNAYDRVPYPSGAHAQTHPGRLAAIGVLYGMVPPAVEHCRVLEIGCGEGSNLISIAFGMPGAEFVGIDLAAKPIESAQVWIDRLGLRNIQVRQMDLLDIGPEFGQFDYIIAHGLYSWVPAPVQDKLLAICSRNLSANGVAFVSYNTNPGGHVRRLLREMMQFHTRRIEDSEKQAREGKAFLGLVLETMNPQTPFRMVFEEEFTRISKETDNIVYHDELSPNFSPVNFADFADGAARHGLQFLSEVELSAMIDVVPETEPLKALRQLAAGDLIACQQYLDFVRFRWFRQTLLCHREVRLCRDRPADRLKRLLVASPLKLSAEQPDGVSEFCDSHGPGTIKTSNTAMIAFLRKIEKIWPRAERFDGLLDAVCAQAPEASQREVADDLSKAVLSLAAMALVDLRTYRLPLAENVSERPEASLLARTEARESNIVTTLLHSHVQFVDEPEQRFLQLLDGTRDRHALADAIAGDHPDVSRDVLMEQIDSNLAKIYRMGLLIA